MERAVPALPVSDLQVARDFYVDRLGFQIRSEASPDGCTGLLGVQPGTIALTLDCPMDGHGRDACAALEPAGSLWEHPLRHRSRMRTAPQFHPPRTPQDARTHRPTGYHANCELCGESYDDENLLGCSRCHRDFCYRCGDWGAGLCTRCLEAEESPKEVPPTNDLFWPEN